MLGKLIYFAFAGVGLVLATWAAAVIGRLNFQDPLAKQRIGCIDGLRGYLALSVMVYHFYVWVQTSRLSVPWASPSSNFISQFGAGAVGLFFMTTGLVFYPRVLAGLRATSWTTVYISRAFRILPLVIVSVAIVTAIIFFRSHVVPDSQYFAAASKWIISWDEVPLLGYADSGRLNAYVLWSLRYEWVFYILLLPICAAAMDLVRTLHRPTWLVPLGFLIIAVAGRSTARKIGVSTPALGYLPLFAIGMLAHEFSIRPAIKSVLTKRWAAILAIGGLLVGMSISSSPYGIALPFFGFFFVCVACGNSLGGILSRKGALILGECSFSIYLLHGIMLDILFVDISAVHAEIAVQFLPVVLPLAALAVIVLAAFSFHFIERPSIAQGKKLARWLSGSKGKLTPQEVEIAP